jgi:hypothetical protein
MRKLVFTLIAVLAAALLVPAQVPAPAPGLQFHRIGGKFYAGAYYMWVGRVVSGPTGAGTGTIQVTGSGGASPGLFTLQDGYQFQPLSTSASIKIDPGLGAAETVTPTAVSCGLNAPFGPAACAVTATFANAHGPGSLVVSGTFGLQEAINDANAQGGGVVVVDINWANAGGTTATITGATNQSTVGIEDARGSVAANTIWYVKPASGAGYAQAPNPMVLPVLSGSITPTATAAAIGVATQTFTVPGLALGDKVAPLALPAPTALCPPVGFRATAINTLSIDFAVLTAAACTPAIGNYSVIVVR